jgi:NmrA-like family
MKHPKGEHVAHSLVTDKNKAVKYAKSCNKFTNVVSVDCGHYLEGFLWEELVSALGGFPLIPDEEGYLTICMPKWGNDPERIPLTAVADDYGHIVHGVLLDPAKYNGKLVQAVSDIKSYDGIAQTFEKVTGKKSRVKYLESAEAFQTYGQPPLEDVREMFRFLQRVQGRYFDGQETEEETARGLKADAFMAMGVPEDYTLTTLEEFFKKHFEKT